MPGFPIYGVVAWDPRVCPERSTSRNHVPDKSLSDTIAERRHLT